MYFISNIFIEIYHVVKVLYLNDVIDKIIHLENELSLPCKNM